MNPERVQKETTNEAPIDYRADTQRLLEKSQAERAEFERRKKELQEAQKNHKPFEQPVASPARSATGALSR